MSNPFPPELIAALSVASVLPVTLLVNLFKPLIERVPGLSPTLAADKPAHDAALQLLNAIASVGATLVLALLGGYITNPQQAWVMGVQIIGIMLASDFNYRGSAKSSANTGAPLAALALPAHVAARLTVSPAQVADALNSAIQSASPQPAPSAMPNAMPNAVKRLADDERPDEPPVTVKLPIVKPATPAVSAAAHA